MELLQLLFALVCGQGLLDPRCVAGRESGASPVSGAQNHVPVGSRVPNVITGLPGESKGVIQFRQGCESICIPLGNIETPLTPLVAQEIRDLSATGNRESLPFRSDNFPSASSH